MAAVLDSDRVVARYDYAPTQPNCIPLVAGAELVVYNRHASGWWEGATASGLRGWFPSNFVQPLPPISDAPSSLPHHASAPQPLLEPDEQEEQVYEDTLPHPSLTLPSTILRATHELESAVRRRENTAYIRCTASVVAATRSTLEALGCLRRTDLLVQTKPGVSLHRKGVLRALGQLLRLSDFLGASDPQPLEGDAPGTEHDLLAALHAVKTALMELVEASVQACPRPRSRELTEIRSRASDSSLGMLSPRGMPVLLAPDVVALPQEVEDARVALQYALDEFVALMAQVDQMSTLPKQPYYPAAFSKLLDITLRVHEGVRQVLHLVERVLASPSHPTLQSTDMNILAGARDDMYRASAQFLASVRRITSAQDQPETGPSPFLSEEGRSAALALTEATHQISLALPARRDSATLPVEDEVDHAAHILSKDKVTKPAATPSSLPSSPQPTLGVRTPSSPAQPARARLRLSLLTRKVASLNMLRSTPSTSSLASSINRTPRSPASSGMPDPVLAPPPPRSGTGLPIPSPDEPDTPPPTMQEKTYPSELDASEVLRNPQGDILGGTLAGLISTLVVPPSQPVESITAAFALTMHLFAQPETVAQVLLERYRASEGEGETRAHILAFVRLWLSDEHWRTSDVEALPTLRLLSHEANADDLLSLIELRSVPGAVSMRLFATGGIAIRRVVGDEGTAAEALYTRPWVVQGANHLPLMRPIKGSFTAVSASELARQLTVLSSRLYLSVEPGEYFSPRSPGLGRRPVYSLNEELNTSLSTQLDEWSRLPSLAALARLSNRIVGWVAETTLAPDSLRERRDVIKHFIKIADKCLALNNFHVFFALQGGLASASIRRLTHTWSSLPSKYTRLASEHAFLVEPRKNYYAYRMRLEQALSRGEPCVPFVGLVLTDLTFALEGNAPTRKATVMSLSSSASSEGNTEVINWARYARAAKIVLSLQGRVYPLQAVDEVQTFLASCLRDALASGTPEKDDRLYRRSLALEPRARPSRTASPYHALGSTA